MTTEEQRLYVEYLIQFAAEHLRSLLHPTPIFRGVSHGRPVVAESNDWYQFRGFATEFVARRD